MDKTLTLYHAVPSLYSQKVRVALAEKGIPYKSRIVSMRSYENLQPWYIKINPKGLVPVLNTGNLVIPESTDIIKYLDKAYPENPLVPTDDSPASIRVRGLVPRLDDIQMHILTYGPYLYPEMVEDSQVNWILRRLMRGRIYNQKEKDLLQRLAEQNPDMRAVYHEKMALIKKRNDGMLSKKDLENELTKLKSVLTEVENALALYATEKAPWLGGEHFTIADITLAVMLVRLKHMGWAKSLWEEGKRPLLAKYYNTVIQRPSVLEQSVKALSEFTALGLAKKAMPPLLLTAVLGAGVAVAVWWFKTH